MKNTDLIAVCGGIEKARGIVAGAPEWSDFYCISADDYFQVGSSELSCCINLKDLRTAIAEHDQHWYGRSEEDELKAYALLSQEKIEGGAWLCGDFSKACNVLNRALTSDSDDVSDIAYHVSPLTKVQCHHQWVNADSIDDTEHQYFCTYCGEKKTEAFGVKHE